MAKTEKSLNDSLREYGRGLTGGLLFSLPMLYTMELWWAGFLSNPVQLLIYFLVGIGLLLIYNRFVGIRGNTSFLDRFLESLEEMGLAILLTAFILWITGRITVLMSVKEISGKIIVEAVTVAIGISVGKAQLGRDREGRNKENEENKISMRHDLIKAIGISLCGALLIASNIAPTDEVIVIALESKSYQLLIIAILSIVIGGLVLYHLNFTGTQNLLVKQKNHRKALAGTIIMYAISLISSAFMLWFFGRFENVSLYGMVAETVVLGFPAALGASAGRLLIQT